MIDTIVLAAVLIPDVLAQASESDRVARAVRVRVMVFAPWAIPAAYAAARNMG